MSSLSLSVNAGADKPPPNLLIPLLLESGPPTITSVWTFTPSTDNTFNCTLPSSNNRISPGTTSFGKSL